MAPLGKQRIYQAKRINAREFCLLVFQEHEWQKPKKGYSDYLVKEHNIDFWWKLVPPPKHGICLYSFVYLSTNQK